MKSRVAARLSCQMRARGAGAVARRQLAKSSSGSCISSAVLAAVLPRPIRAASTQRDADAGRAKRQATAAPVMPPPTIATSTSRFARQRGKAGAPASRAASSQSGLVDAQTRHRRTPSWRRDCYGSRRDDESLDDSAVLDRLGLAAAVPEARPRRARRRRDRRRRHHRPDRGVSADAGRPPVAVARARALRAASTPATRPRT